MIMGGAPVGTGKTGQNGQAGSSSAAACSAVGSGFVFVTVTSVSVITAPFLLNTRLSDQCRKYL